MFRLALVLLTALCLAMSCLICTEALAGDRLPLPTSQAPLASGDVMSALFQSHLAQTMKRFLSAPDIPGKRAETVPAVSHGTGPHLYATFSF